MYLDLAPRHLSAILSIAAIALLSGCADTRGGSIPYERPLAAPDEQKFQTLEQNYKIAPMDNLAIKASTAHVLTVNGAVKESGSFPIGGPVLLIQAVALAKGTTEDANPRRVAVLASLARYSRPC